MMSPNATMVFKYLQENHDKDLTANDVAEAVGLRATQVNAIFTTVIQNKKYGYRDQEIEITLPDGNRKKAKMLRLTEEGMNYSFEDNQ